MSSQFPTRRGLSESLEEYAHRAGLRREDARPIWRLHGLDALGVLGAVVRDTRVVFASTCRVAPGVAVPVPDLTPADVIEHDNPRIGSTLTSALAEWERRDQT